MISFVLAMIIAVVVIVSPSSFFDFQKKPTYNPAMHLPLAQGVRTPNQEQQDGGDVSTSLPIERDKYLPPHAVSGASEFSTPLSAASALVIDVASNQILYAKNIDEPRSIASITKLMTAQVILDTSPNWQKTVKILPEDMRIGPDYLEEGEAVRVRDLWNTLLIGSSNTAAVALARSTGLTSEEFVARMNQKAKAMGLVQSTFVEPSGLDPQNQATARELSVILRYALRRPEIADVVTKHQYRFAPVGAAVRTVSSTDWLITGQAKRLSTAEIIGGKTGYIEQAGYCFAAHMMERNHTIAVIVLGAADHFSRFTEADTLAAWAFHHYMWEGEEGY